MKRARLTGVMAGAASLAVLGSVSGFAAQPAVCTLRGPCAALSGESGPVDAATAEALRASFMDERRVEEFYGDVIARHGRVRPFANIIRAEARHAAVLQALMERHGVAAPTDGPVDVPEVPATLAECRAVAARAERENIAMYDKFLEEVTEPDVRAVFANLRQASRRNHLPAFDGSAGGRAGAWSGAGRGGRLGPAGPVGRAGQAARAGRAGRGVAGNRPGPGRGGACCGGCLVGR